MTDIATLAEQGEKLRFISRKLAPEQLLQFADADDLEFYGAQKSRVDARIGDETPALGAGICRRGAGSGRVTQQIAGSVIIERLQRSCELDDRFFQILAILGQQQAARM